MAISVTSLGLLADNSQTTTSVLTLAAAVPSGSLIVTGVNRRDQTYNATDATIADTASNTYTIITQSGAKNATSLLHHQIYYVRNCTALSSGNTITVTSPTTGYINISAIYATGVNTSTGVVDTSACAVSASPFSNASSSNVTVTSGTPTVAGDLFVYLVTFRGGVTSPTLDTSNGWTNTPGTSLPNNAGTVTGVMGYQINTGTGTKTNFTSWFGNQYSASSIAAFKDATPPASTSNGNMFLMF